MTRRISRRRLLGLALAPAAAVAAGAALVARGGGDTSRPEPASAAAPEATPAPPIATPTRTPPTPTATPEPLVVAAGIQERTLMGGSSSETTAVIIGSGREGPIAAVFGGVHGNEPGGWLAAEVIAAWQPPQTGALIVIPRANLVATNLFERTTEELGDLNRLYPGDPDGLPMEQMAFQIVELLREFQASLVLDLHESWAFYKDRTETQTGTAYLGQTISSSDSAGIAFAQEIAGAVNARILYSHEELIPRNWPPPGGGGMQFSGSGSGRGRSSLGLPRHVPGLTALLVEMGQQQALERRVALHLDVVGEALRRRGLYPA